MSHRNGPDWLAGPIFGDPHADQLSRLVHGASAFTVLASLIFALFSWVAHPDEIGRFVVVAGVLVICTVIQLLLRTERLRASAALLVFMAWGIPTLSAVMRGEVHAAVIGVYMLVVPLAGLALGHRAAGWMFVFVLLSVVGLHAGLQSHAFPAPIVSSGPTMRFSLDLLTVACGGGMLYMASRHLFAMLQSVREHEIALERTRASLDVASKERDDAEQARAGLELRLQQGQKLESIGRLAGGVAHDFNNLLTVIVNNAELAKSGDVGTHLDEISDAAGRAGGLVRQLLAFSRQQVLEPGLLDLGDVVREMESMLVRLIGEHIVWRLEAEEGLDAVLADKSQLQQVVMNLVVNGADAMPTGGELSVRLATVDRDEADDGIPPGRYVCLTVHDTGIGIPPEAMAHIFEPFYTQKALGEGTGLGLSMVHGVVTQSGGYVRVDSTFGVETTMTVWLPSAGPVPGRISSARRRPSRSVRGQVLLVEDEPTVRRVVERVLRHEGFAVVVVDAPAEALAWMGEQSAKPDLLLSDVVMPDMSGPELYRELERRGYLGPVVFMSGYAGDIIEKHGGMPDGAVFLQKPFDPKTLTEAVHAAIAGDDAMDGVASSR